MQKIALFSVSDKDNIIEFANDLEQCGWGILGTKGTKECLSKAGISVKGVEEVSGMDTQFSGRLKTLHPKIMGGILFERDNTEHMKELKELDAPPIDLVYVTLYPFEDAAKKKTKDKELVDKIDIGGVTLLRAAAKNYASVTVICDKEDMRRALTEIKKNGTTSLALRKELAAKAFLRTAAYDTVITETLSDFTHSGFILTNGECLRYGENPHQKGAFYELFHREPKWTVYRSEKKISYLNILDADGAWNLVREFKDPAAACIKHANPSGVASHTDITQAFQRAYDADRLSAFGVIIALNRPCTKEIIDKIIDQNIFVEIIIAPGYEDGVLEVLKKKPNIRIIAMNENIQGSRYVVRSALGGMLVQTEDEKILTSSDITCVTQKKPSEKEIEDLLFAWTVVKHTKSNAIVFAKDTVTVGIGAGQTSRVDATWIAAKRAGKKSKDACMASDAFFPFPDSIEEAAKHGITSIIQPGGSIRDKAVIAKADELGLSMVVTGIRAFRH